MSTKISQREQIAAFMIRNSFATGHGDTLADLLSELEWQVKARAALPAGDGTGMDGWQTIDSAPKDGRWVFLHVPGHGPARARWHARMGWESHNNGREITKATHWRPMFGEPSAPISASSGGSGK